MISSARVVRKSFGRWEHLFDQEGTTAIISFAFNFRLSIVWKTVHKRAVPERFKLPLILKT